jgi:ATP-binding cassette subfamily F protein 3
VRLALARALMTPSDLLLLDEPTNHLDLDTTVWLQNFLRRYRGTLLLISHDRDFIDACCNAVLHIEQQAHSYRGGYSDFERQRALRLAERRAAAEKQARRRAEIEDFVRRFRAKATKARQAQSRLKELANAWARPPSRTRTAPSNSASRTRPGPRPAAGTARGAIGYGTRRCCQKAWTSSLRSGERIALLGRNGSGKTTLLRSLCGELRWRPAERGMRSEGCRIAYFDQQQIDTLDLDASALLHLQRLTPSAREQEMRDFLGGFDFRGSAPRCAAAPVFRRREGAPGPGPAGLAAPERAGAGRTDQPPRSGDAPRPGAGAAGLRRRHVILVSHDRHLLRSAADRCPARRRWALEPFDDDLASYERSLICRAKAPARRCSSRQESGRNTDANPTDRGDQRRAAAAASATPPQGVIRQLEQAMEAQQAALTRSRTRLADPALYDTGATRNSSRTCCGSRASAPADRDAGAATGSGAGSAGRPAANQG